jgi:uncharacterized membrane protein YjdF
MGKKVGVIYFIAGIFLVLLAASILAPLNHWYDRWWWLDSALHFLAGAGTAAAVFYYWVRRLPIASRLEAIVIIVSLTALAGLFWEFYEFGIDIIFGNQNSFWKQQYGLADTLEDLFFDFLGALAAAVFIKLKIKS